MFDLCKPANNADTLWEFLLGISFRPRLGGPNLPPATRRVASRRVASRRVASRRVASRRVASRRVARGAVHEPAAGHPASPGGAHLAVPKPQARAIQGSDRADRGTLGLGQGMWGFLWVPFLGPWIGGGGLARGLWGFTF